MRIKKLLIALIILLSFIMANQPFSFAQSPSDYQVCVKTDLREDAGTDDDIKITLQDENGVWTDEFSLDDDRDNFEQGSYECFQISTNITGRIRRIKVDQKYNDIPKHRCRSIFDSAQRNNDCPYPKWWPEYFQVANKSSQDYSFFFISHWFYADVAPQEFEASD